MDWEPAIRTAGRSLGTDLTRLLAIADPRGSFYRDAHYYSATVEVDPGKMRQWLPAGMRLAEPARADVFTAYFPEYNYGTEAYHEAAVFVHVKTLQGTGIHCVWMVLDDDVALIMGREGAGYPKKLGQIDWAKTDTEIRAEAGRRGHKLVRMSGRLGEVIEDAPPFLGRPHRNVMGLMGALFPSFVVGFTPREKIIEARRVEDFTLEIGGSERDPLDQMGLGRVVEARLHRVDLFATGLPPIPLRPLSPLFTLTHLRPRIL
ncbi:acetoacetate decarboxylase family protein [Nocardia inohanensis]|uniref:acetoacetate decarboxylase family protein n=1 Tax=Nocardia inohanensis TaxID=209246 RepID=UPI000835EF04|nr:acetoacetate decarboxylase family protein [Nocardia inohanensis]